MVVIIRWADSFLFIVHLMVRTRWFKVISAINIDKFSKRSKLMCTLYKHTVFSFCLGVDPHVGCVFVLYNYGVEIEFIYYGFTVFR